MTNNPQRDLSTELHEQFGLDTVSLQYGLSQDELFLAAVHNDRGKVDPDGDTNQQKAYQTALGVDGPLVYFTDPSCTGRPVNDTFAVARDSVMDTVWWKDGLSKFSPENFDKL
ncbi:uncharacterized protein METZ01_LOCUS508448, partial [marine metagenome]